MEEKHSHQDHMLIRKVINLWCTSLTDRLTKLHWTANRKHPQPSQKFWRRESSYKK
jgi:hypothetical protein